MMALIWAALSRGFTNGPLAADAVGGFSPLDLLNRVEPKIAPNVTSIASRASKISIGPRRRRRFGREVGASTTGGGCRCAWGCAGSCASDVGLEVETDPG